MWNRRTVLFAGGLLALLAAAVACGSQPTAAQAPPLTVGPAPTQAPVSQETPQAGTRPIISGTPTLTPETSLQSTQDLTLSTQGILIRIAPVDGGYFTFEGDLFKKLESLPHVSNLERYLVVELGAMEPNDAIIGVEPGSPLRIIRGGEAITATVYSGETFEGLDADASSAIAGKVRPQAGSGMAGMVHEFMVGQSLTMFGYPDRIRVIGKYRSESESQDFNFFLPIETAQKVFEKEGQLSYLFVSVDSPDNVARVEEDLRSLLSVR